MKMKTNCLNLKSIDINKKVITAVLLFFWFLVVLITLVCYNSSLGKQSFGNNVADSVVELDNNTSIEEVLFAEENTDSVAIKIATYARKNKGNITLVVKGIDSDTVYVEKSFGINSLQDNAFKVIKLNTKISNKEKIRISLLSDSEKGSSVGVYYSSNKEIEDGQLIINSEIMNGDLTFRMLTPDNDLHNFYLIVLIWTIVGITVLIVTSFLTELKKEIIFSLSALIIGISFCMIITPMSVPDEQTHYEFAFQKSNYIMNKDNHLLFDSEYQNYGSYAGHMNVSSAYKKIMQKFNSPLSLSNEMVEMKIDVDKVYNIDFLAPALGITVARGLGLNRFKTFYMGRLFNLLFYVLCVFVSIRKTPVHKTLFGIISILPIFMQQAASYSYDCFVNGLSLVVISYLLKFIFVEEKIKYSELFVIIVVTSLLSPAKAIYSFFSLLFIFVPTKRYKSTAEKIGFTFLICASGVYQLLDITIPILNKLLKSINTSKSNVENVLYNSVTPYISRQIISRYKDIRIGDVISNPWLFLSMVIRTIRYNIKNWFYDSLGRTLSGVSLILPTYLVHAITIIVLLSALLKERYTEPRYLKLIFVAMCIVIGLYTIGGFLLTWTDMDQDIIEDFGGLMVQGIQGRYFCPLLPFFFTIFNNKKINIPTKLDKYITYTYYLIVFEVIIYVLSYTFVN